eukprot:1159964-Pelagomonas_calceolata.AAC.5
MSVDLVAHHMSVDCWWIGHTHQSYVYLAQIFPRHVIEALSTGVLTTENLAAMAKKHTDVTIVFLGKYLHVTTVL